MLTIQNYKKIESITFWTNVNTQQWIVSRIVETPDEYQMAVLPKDELTGTYSIADGIVYGVKRVSDNPDGYKIFNSKNSREAWIMRKNLTLDNFLLELRIQTSLNTM